MTPELKRLREKVDKTVLAYSTHPDADDAMEDERAETDRLLAEKDAEIQTLREGLIWAAEAADITAETLQRQLSRAEVRALVVGLKARAKKLLGMLKGETS